MAEIRSTMDMVMERAARLEAEQGGADPRGEDEIKEGMRAAAAYMREEEIDLAAALERRRSEAKADFITGVAEGLLRNITLPREEEQLDKAGLAMNGLVQVGRNHQDLLAICGDLTKILDQYRQHRQQLKEQLEAGFAQQMPQLEAAMAQKTGMAMKLKPSQHPRYQEEWQRALDDLNGQYGRAIEQHKQMVVRILASMV
ncbi:MAG: hypothetical protein RQ753_09845 [Desulfurivibrionaceae bacterium]|nr:hypothetical protein [Desulfobulbales bacterium]MDT8335990.1 hypothetical protein [Desulfurivibrionaceae bacterium]